MCKVLTLAEKIQVIDAVNSGLSNVKVASKFQCGRTQIAYILLNKTAILEAYTNGTKSSTKYLQPCNCQYHEINVKVLEFYFNARSKNMPVNGGLLKAEALAVVTNLNLKEFSASNGWLDSFSARHQLRYGTLHGQSAGVDSDVCDQWRHQLPCLCEGYSMRDIWNIDETGIFFRTVPNKSFIRHGEVPHGTKAQTLKERFTVLLCCNATGKKEKIVVVGKSKHPTLMPKPVPKTFK